jgi:ketosteroid isomerase-like protein
MMVIYATSSPVSAKSDDKAEITALEEHLVASIHKKDLDGIMSCYIPDESLFVFDLIPPRQYVGAKAYRENWNGVLSGFATIDAKLTDLVVTTNGSDLAFSHSIQHITGKDAKGTATELVLRAMDCYRRINGKWLIVQENYSVPVNLETGKPDFLSKP